MASKLSRHNDRFPVDDNSKPSAREVANSSNTSTTTSHENAAANTSCRIDKMRQVLFLAAYPLEHSDSSWLVDTNSTVLRRQIDDGKAYRKHLKTSSNEAIVADFESYLSAGRDGLFTEANCRRACRLPCWSAEEAAFYSFGLEFPGERGLRIIRKDQELIETRNSGHGRAGLRRAGVQTPAWITFSVHLLERLDLIRRAIRTNELPEPIQPGQFIRWAERRNIRLPFSLISGAKTEVAEIEDWRDRYEDAQRTLTQQKLDHRRALDKTFAENTELKQEIARLTNLNDTLIRTGDGPRLRRSESLKNAQIILVCMAREKYGWNNSMDAVARQIAAATASYLDGGLSPDTVKRNLKKGLALIDGTKRQSSVAES